MLPWPALVRIAEEEVEDVLGTLPPDFARWAREVPVVLEAAPSPALVADGLAPDTLGLFVGLPHPLHDAGLQPAAPIQIQLFLENLWRFSRGNARRYRAEVRRTLLHELGHYLGWDEDDLAERDLD